MLGSKFTKFLSILKKQIGFSSNFASIFSIMRHNSSLLFLAEIVYTFHKRSLSKYKFGEIHLSSQNFSEIFHFDKNHLKFQLKKHRRVISHDTEGWCKVERKTDFWFQIWHEGFGEFSPNHSEVQKFHFDGLFLS